MQSEFLDREWLDLCQRLHQCAIHHGESAKRGESFVTAADRGSSLEQAWPRITAVSIFAILVTGVEYALGIQNYSLTPMPFNEDWSEQRSRTCMRSVTICGGPIQRKMSKSTWTGKRGRQSRCFPTVRSQFCNTWETSLANNGVKVESASSTFQFWKAACRR